MAKQEQLIFGTTIQQQVQAPLPTTVQAAPFIGHIIGTEQPASGLGVPTIAV